MEDSEDELNDLLDALPQELSATAATTEETKITKSTSSSWFCPASATKTTKTRPKSKNSKGKLTPGKPKNETGGGSPSKTKEKKQKEEKSSETPEFENPVFIKRKAKQQPTPNLDDSFSDFDDFIPSSQPPALETRETRETPEKKIGFKEKRKSLAKTGLSDSGAESDEDMKDKTSAADLVKEVASKPAATSPKKKSDTTKSKENKEEDPLSDLSLDLSDSDFEITMESTKVAPAISKPTAPARVRKRRPSKPHCVSESEDSDSDFSNRKKPATKSRKRKAKSPVNTVTLDSDDGRAIDAPFAGGSKDSTKTTGSFLKGLKSESNSRLKILVIKIHPDLILGQENIDVNIPIKGADTVTLVGRSADQTMEVATECVSIATTEHKLTPLARMDGNESFFVEEIPCAAVIEVERKNRREESSNEPVGKNEKLMPPLARYLKVDAMIRQMPPLFMMPKKLSRPSIHQFCHDIGYEEVLKKQHALETQLFLETEKNLERQQRLEELEKKKQKEAIPISSEDEEENREDGNENGEDEEEKGEVEVEADLELEELLFKDDDVCSREEFKSAQSSMQPSPVDMFHDPTEFDEEREKEKEEKEEETPELNQEPKPETGQVATGHPSSPKVHKALQTKTKKIQCSEKISDDNDVLLANALQSGDLINVVNDAIMSEVSEFTEKKKKKKDKEKPTESNGIKASEETSISETDFVLTSVPGEDNVVSGVTEEQVVKKEKKRKKKDKQRSEISLAESVPLVGCIYEANNISTGEPKKKEKRDEHISQTEKKDDETVERVTKEVPLIKPPKDLTAPLNITVVDSDQTVDLRPAVEAVTEAKKKKKKKKKNKEKEQTEVTVECSSQSETDIPSFLATDLSPSIPNESLNDTAGLNTDEPLVVISEKIRKKKQKSKPQTNCYKVESAIKASAASAPVQTLLVPSTPILTLSVAPSGSDPIIRSSAGNSDDLGTAIGNAETEKKKKKKKKRDRDIDESSTAAAIDIKTDEPPKKKRKKEKVIKEGSQLLADAHLMSEATNSQPPTNDAPIASTEKKKRKKKEKEFEIRSAPIAIADASFTALADASLTAQSLSASFLPSLPMPLNGSMIGESRKKKRKKEKKSE